MSYDVYSKFDIEEHKKKYVNYLEVIILEDGTIEYAVPSHQEYLINLMMRQYGITRDDVLESTPHEYYCDWMKWLCLSTKAVSVWNNYIEFYEMNIKQYNALKKLKLNGLYKGYLPKSLNSLDG